MEYNLQGFVSFSIRYAHFAVSKTLTADPPSGVLTIKSCGLARPDITAKFYQ